MGDETTVMCAAHCFDKGQSMSGYNIRAGVKDKGDNSGQTIEIANGVWNEEMPYVGNNNDFIILKLSSTLTFNDNVGPACLPDPDHAPDTKGQTCFVSGWGTLSSGGSSPSALQWVAVPTVTNDQCNQAYNGITDSMICAGLPEGGKDSCQGDSGGPFVCRDNGKAVLTGVVSFGIGCALADYPGVYARTTAVLDWVKANMGGDAPAPPPPGPTTTQGPAECPSNYVGDSYCDDECNNEDNNFDGGDCCGDDVNEQYCSTCECLDDGATEGSTEGSSEDPTGGPTEPPMDECGAPQWFGDTYCDDENNNPECGFDGGDCCQEDPNDGWDNYCEFCDCLEMEATTEPPMGECAIPHWFGDNYCDDENNTPECGFDGGDCCGDDVNTSYCSECECFDFPETTQAPDGSNCEIPHWFGDSYCDDENNNADCGFDGGDCCGDDVNTTYCSACDCLE